MSNIADEQLSALLLCTILDQTVENWVQVSVKLYFMNYIKLFYK